MRKGKTTEKKLSTPKTFAKKQKRALLTNSWIIELPDVHPSLNSWVNMHFHSRNNLKQEWGKMVHVYAKLAGLPMIDKPVEVFITYHHPKDTVDLDNYTPKFIMDGLKPFFIDDNIKCVVKLGWEFKRGSIRKSVVKIKLAK